MWEHNYTPVGADSGLFMGVVTMIFAYVLPQLVPQV